MKKSINKLSLNKMTISNLSYADMNQRIGGAKSKVGICMPALTPGCPSTQPATCSVCNCEVKK